MSLENLWMDLISKIHKFVSEGITRMNNIKKIYENTIGRPLNSNIIYDTIDDMYEHHSMQFEKELINYSKMEYIFLSHVKSNAKYDDSLFRSNCLNIHLINSPILYKPSIEFLGHSKIVLNSAVDAIIPHIEANLNELEHFLPQLIGHVITFARYNRNIYLKLQSSMIKNDTDKCLICIVQINNYPHAQFIKCNHKICLSCIDRFMITHGTCPFDKPELSNLQMIYESNTIDNSLMVSNYLIENFEKLSEKLFYEIQHYNDKRVKNLIDCNYNISKIMEHVYALDKEMKTENPNNNNVKKLFKNIKHSKIEILVERILI